MDDEAGRPSFEERVAHLRHAVPVLVLEGVIASLAWLLAQELVGEEASAFAPIAAVLTLGLTLGEHNARALAVAVGVTLGLAVAGLLVDLIGDGIWQLGVVIVLARAAAILADGSMLAVNQATVSAVLVVVLHNDDVFPGDRLLDAVIGAALALAAVALLRRAGWKRWRDVHRPAPSP